jgi:hypothetical protein
MNYEITTAVPADYGIHPTTDEVDGCYVFATFDEAKRALIASLSRQKALLGEAIKEVRALKMKDI